MKVLSVVGARPNFMKIAPIARAISEHNECSREPFIEHLIIHTGQHYDDFMSARFFDDLDLPRPHVNLNVGSATHAVQTARIMEAFEPVLLQEKPDALLVVGDVNSTIACTLVASKIEYDISANRTRPIIAHVEAGLRSFDRNMPEEINRTLTDALCDLLFTTEEGAELNLKREGIPVSKIHFVGNVMIDSLVYYREKARLLNTLDELGCFDNRREREFGVVTLHRPTNVDDPAALKSFVGCLESISENLPLIFPVHPRTRKNLDEFGITGHITNKNISLVPPLSYLEFLNLLLCAKLVLTDSGGIQEETTFLQVPCITLRKNTERPVTIRLGTNHLVGTDPQKILETTFSILNGNNKKGIIPPLWDGKASKRILEILTQSVNFPDPQQ
jgi:UDP-N-acetylglucosamine 2-epimerase (non-hydrolysing)